MPHSTDATLTTSTTIDEKPNQPGQNAHLLLDNNQEPLPYWLVNVPRSQWPAECPDFLRNLPPKNISILSSSDDTYERQNWDMAKEFVKANQIDRFQRLPSDLRKYLEYTARIKAQYGSVMRFVVKERLRWGDGNADDLKPKGRPFELDEDIKILYNDWPYGVDKGIIHLVVWVKFELEDDPATDDLTPKARQEIDDYVQRTFRSRIPSDQVIWFKNWTSLKSVHAVEHFHVMLNNPDTEFMREITRGDIPLIERIRSGQEQMN